MSRWLLYHRLTMLDVLRLWPTVQHHVIIVAGICLPILLLLGLKNGHVADLRQELLRSPTGRQIVFWSGQHAELMAPSTIDRYEQEIPGVDLIIPEVQRLVSISVEGTEGDDRSVDDVTLYSTRSGDPILRQHAADVLDGSERGIVLVRRVAEALKVEPGQDVIVTVQRQSGGVSESVSVSLTLEAVIEQGRREGGDVGYVDCNLLTAMEQYILGFQVARLGWSAFAAPAPDEYTSYLIFCEKLNPLAEDDLRAFSERGYVAEIVEQEDVRILFGLLKPESLDELLVYRLAAHGAEGWRPLSIAPGEITRFTEADDIAIPWNEPKWMEIDGVSRCVVGLSLPKRTWLKLYMEQRECGFGYDAETLSVQFPGPNAHEASVANLKIANGTDISLNVATIASPEPSPAASGDLPLATEEVKETDDGEAAEEMPIAPAEMPPSDTAEQEDNIEAKGHGNEAGEATQATSDSENDESISPIAKPMLQDDTADNAVEKEGSDEGEGEGEGESQKESPADPQGADAHNLAPDIELIPSVKENLETPPAGTDAKPLEIIPESTIPEAAVQDETDRDVVESGDVQLREDAPTDGADMTAVADIAAEQAPELGSPVRPEETQDVLRETDKSSPADGLRDTSAEADVALSPAAQKVDYPLAIVPMDLLAHLYALEAGRTEFDPAVALFVPTPREPLFDKARLYTNTIDDVPSVVQWLQDHRFAVMSEATRITEIHQQDQSLEILVLIVGVGVLLFGTVTVVSVLLDSTERKRGTLGILRVMGVSRFGVFYLVFLRATIIAVLAAGLTIIVGYAISSILGWQPQPASTLAHWKPVIHLILRPEDLLVVILGSLACCGLGSMIPARKASRMDPFDAIVEGRFR